MSNEDQVKVTAIIWMAIAVGLFGLFLSGLADAGLTVVHLAIAALLLVVPSVATGFIWRGSGYADKETQSEKVKRERIEEVLRNLSDDELIALKKRFQSNEIDDEMLYAHLEEQEYSHRVDN